MDDIQPGSKHKIHEAHASASSDVREHVFVQGYEQSHWHTTRFFKSKYLSMAKEWDSSLTKNNGYHSNPPFFLSAFQGLWSQWRSPIDKRALHHKWHCKSEGLWTVKVGGLGSLTLQLAAYGTPEAVGTAIYLVLFCLGLLLLLGFFGGGGQG